MLLGIGQEDLRAQTTATLAELGEDIDLIGVAETSSDLLLAVDNTADLDVVVIDHQFGPLPYLSLVRELVTRVPDLAVMVMVTAPDVATLQSVMDAGGRAVIERPPSHDELSGRLASVLEWQRQLRILAGTAQGRAEPAGRLIAFTGAKGGTGTTTVALHTALLARVSNPEHRVCLIDMDLQSRGMRQLFDVSAKRTLADLAPISDSLTGRNLDEVAVVHHSGLRVLMAPENGEQSEEITGAVARQVIAAAKGHFDLIVIDTGTTVTDATAVAMDFADTQVMVATPDVPSIRAAQDKLDMLDRLQAVNADNMNIVFNKVSSRNEVQPEFASRMTSAVSTKVNLPEDGKRLEAVANAMTPMDLEDGPFRRAIVALGRELRLKIPGPEIEPTKEGSSSGRRSKRRRRRGADGQVTIEAIVGLIAAMLIFIALVQVALMALANPVGKRAADEAARVAARGGSVAEAKAAAESVTPGFYGLSLSALDEDSYEVTLSVPNLMPGWDPKVSASAEAAREGD